MYRKWPLHLLNGMCVGAYISNQALNECNMIKRKYLGLNQKNDLELWRMDTSGKLKKRFVEYRTEWELDARKRFGDKLVDEAMDGFKLRDRLLR